MVLAAGAAWTLVTAPVFAFRTIELAAPTPILTERAAVEAVLAGRG